MNDIDAFPRPASVDERIARRGCRNCLAYDSGRCRAQPGGLVVGPTDWCLNWRWSTNPRVGWESAFAGLELDENLNPAVAPAQENTFEDGF